MVNALDKFLLNKSSSNIKFDINAKSDINDFLKNKINTANKLESPIKNNLTIRNGKIIKQILTKKQKATDYPLKLIQQIPLDVNISTENNLYIPVSVYYQDTDSYVTKKLSLSSLEELMLGQIEEFFVTSDGNNTLAVNIIKNFFKNTQEVQFNIVDGQYIEVSIADIKPQILKSNYIVFDYDLSISNTFQNIDLPDGFYVYFVKINIPDIAINLPNSYKSILPDKNDGFFDDEILLNLYMLSVPEQPINIFLEINTGNNDSSFRTIRITNNKSILVSYNGDKTLRDEIRILMPTDNEISSNSTFGLVSSKLSVDIKYLNLDNQSLFVFNPISATSEYNNIVARNFIRCLQNVMTYSSWYAKGVSEVPAGGLRWEPQMSVESNRYFNFSNQLPEIISNTGSIYTSLRRNERPFKAYSIINLLSATNTGMISHSRPLIDSIPYLFDQKLNYSTETGNTLFAVSGANSLRRIHYFTSRKLQLCDWYVDKGVVKKRNQYTSTKDRNQLLTFGFLIKDILKIMRDTSQIITIYLDLEIQYGFRFEKLPTDTYYIAFYRDDLVSIDFENGLNADDDTESIYKIALNPKSNGNTTNNPLNFVNHNESLRISFDYYYNGQIRTRFWFTPQ